ncbi:hypothetical protein B9Q17_15515 [Marinobacter vinifirmus]|uniref:O-antigen ligase-related domain-containing protein n=2 Tax=Marinobacter vinifirmus TaxID=355591 RepID=A0A7Z1DXS5_9GAMM|nr:hypothetical protein B9Q17_15515 [Marinobacter vinifirmus]
MVLRAFFGALLSLLFIQLLFSEILPGSFGSYNYQRFSFLFLALLFGVLFFLYYFRVGFEVSFFFIAFPHLFFVFCVLSASASASALSGYSYSLVEPAFFSFYFCLSFFLGKLLADMGRILSACFFFLYFAFFFCAMYGFSLISIYIFAILDSVSDLSVFIPSGFVNIRYWSHVATWFVPLFPLAVLVGPLKNNMLLKVIMLLASGLWWWALFLTTSRGSILGIIFGVLVVLCFFHRKAMPWLKVFLQYLFAGIVIWLLLSVAIPSFMADGVQVRSIKTDSSGRIPLFVEAWKMSLQNFPFGMGPQSWLTHEPITEAYATGKKFGHPHNMYLMWAAEYGWLLIAAMGLVVVQAIRNFWRRRAELFESGDSNQLLLLAGFTASVSAALFHAGVSAVFMAPGSMLVGLFVLIGFWALILPAGDSLQEARSTANPRRRMIVAGLLSAAFLILWALWMNEVWQYYQDMRADEAYYYEHESEGTLPRFWFHGNYPRD